MIKASYTKPLRYGSQVFIEVDKYSLSGEVYINQLESNNNYFILFTPHVRSIAILEKYFNVPYLGLYDVFNKLIPDMSIALWPYTSLENLEKILDNISIFEEL